ncbi:glyoxalase/bleomycin resistance/extradiol dioxygenase family protein [Stenotrophomonas acidaminiphila]|nr:glyoxalase/bleomycin resistance/extradiol dioxygenase family protein [Stenotrophomonas acidaminiphila]WHL19241.1 glyoxalase/bleomycin resistance/extradiol dioxygenase family protein [Stenotrophomonas acidaminiphila]
MVISDTIYVMLLVEPFFRGFTPRPLCDARSHTEVITCLSAPSRAAVDALLDKALAAGADEPMPARDYGFMYQRGFQDLDGHLWEIAHMDGEPG